MTCNPRYCEEAARSCVLPAVAPYALPVDLFVLQLDAMFDVIGIESVAGERVMFAFQLRDLSFEGFVFSREFL